MTTVCSLPPEVLVEIFLACGNASDSTGAFHTTWSGLSQSYIPPAPLVLSHICVRWKHIALDTPRLWSSLQLSWSIDTLSKCRELFQMWLSRSKNLPLELHLADINPSASDPIVTLEMLKCVLPVQHRWKHIYLALNWWVQATPLSRLGGGSGTMPLLETFALERCSRDVAQWFVKHDCPSLRRVLFNTGMEALPVVTFPAPWGCLEQLVSSKAESAKGVLDVLSQYTNLTSLSISLQNPGLERHHPPILLPRLQELRIVAPVRSALPCILDALTLPNLSHLVFHQVSTFRLAPFPPPSLVHLLKRSQPPLETLHLLRQSLVSFSDKDMISLLRLVPHLVSFSLTLLSASKSVLGEALVREVATSAVVPALRSFQLLTTAQVTLEASKEIIQGLATTRKGLRVDVDSTIPWPPPALNSTQPSPVKVM